MNMTRVDFELLKVGQCTHPECIAMRGGHFKHIVFPALCFLIQHPTRGWILFDTGYSAEFFQATQPFPERFYRWITPVTFNQEDCLVTQLANRSLSPLDIRYIVISHFHADHIAGLKNFPNATYITLKTEYESMRKKSRLNGLLHAFLRTLLPIDFERRLMFADEQKSLSLPKVCQPLTQGFDIFHDQSIIAIPLPGHTAGQMGILFKTQEDKYIFLVGDACWTTDSLKKNQVATIIASLIIDNRKNYLNTFEQLRTISLSETEIQIIPSHCQHSWKESQIEKTHQDMKNRETS